MDNDFNFNAPQYADFSQVGQDSPGDSYFDVQEEIIPTAQTQQEKITIQDDHKQLEAEEYVSFCDDLDTIGPAICLSTKMRRSLSTNDIHNHKPCSDLGDKNSESTLSNCSPSPIVRPNSACGHDRRYRAPSKERINQLAQPKRSRSQDNGKDAGMTLAEAVSKFQISTPKRFRSRETPILATSKLRAPLVFAGTIPQSPNLKTKGRLRPVTATTKEEREFEEMKKFKFKATTVSQKVLKGPVKAQWRPATIVQNVKKNQEIVKQNKTPVLNGHKSSTVTSKLVTKPASIKKPTNIRTQLKPFSFEERDQKLMKKKEEFIKKVHEEEKKAREFHANPIPSFVRKASSQSLEATSESGSSTSTKHSKEDLEVTTAFKARPATVLTTKPFVPKKDQDHVIPIDQFHFASDDRLEARRKFEQQIAQKQLELEQHKKRLEEEAKKKEEEEVLKLRALATHKAQPIRKYKEVQITSAAKVTEPVSPKFHLNRLRKRDDDKENVQNEESSLQD